MALGYLTLEDDDLWTCTLADVVHEWVDSLDSMHGSIGSCPHVVDAHPQPPIPPPPPHTNNRHGLVIL